MDPNGAIGSEPGYALIFVDGDGAEWRLKSHEPILTEPK